MCKLICVTNSTLCEDMEGQLRRLAEAGVDSIILREKALTEQEYTRLAARTAETIKPFGTRLILHSFYSAALKLGVKSIHLPLPVLEALDNDTKQCFEHIGASVHSPEEAARAAALGADCLVAGHIFNTDCKQGLPGRGLEYLNEVCQRVNVPVYAIGGITPDNAGSVIDAGAKGICVMSGLMKSDAPEKLVGLFKESLRQHRHR